jgi:FG-GAP repeat
MAWVFSGSSYSTTTPLTANDPSGLPLFGSSVALSEDGKTALVGAPAQSHFNGEAYVFTGSGYHTQTHLLPSVSGVTIFGYDVALSGDGRTGSVGAPSVNHSGAVYRFTGNAFGNRVEITASDGKSGDSFGRAVAIDKDGGLIVIGAKSAGAGAGAAYFGH